MPEQEPAVLEGLERLRACLAGLESAVIGFSGGVDSTLVACVAHEVLGDRMLAVTSCAETYADWEQQEARTLAGRFGFRHRFVQTSELAIEGYAENNADRCYHCKGALYRTLADIAVAEGYQAIVDGVTADDADDFRPGRRAAAEAGSISPLVDCGLDKAAIRAISRHLDLPTWDKPANACLSSRIPYGETITREKLRQVEQAEDALRALGIRNVRVRHHGTVARIEVEPADLPRLAGPDRASALAGVEAAGFTYVALDLAGYRTGSLHQVLSPEVKLEALGVQRGGEIVPIGPAPS